MKFENKHMSFVILWLYLIPILLGVHLLTDIAVSMFTNRNIAQLDVFFLVLFIISILGRMLAVLLTPKSE